MQSFTQKNIGFIGSGNMAKAICKGLISYGHSKQNLFLSSPSADHSDSIRKELEVTHFSSNQQLVDHSEIIILAVKPQKLKDALNTVEFKTDTQIISVVAGVTIEQISKHCSLKKDIIRAMPNTPATELCGATGLYAPTNTSKNLSSISEYIFGSIGTFHWVENEHQIDVVTALAGSSPAYFFAFMEAMIEAGISQGMPRDTARGLVVQSALGAATYITNHKDIPISTRREQVTSPAGTTAAALSVFKKHDLDAITLEAVNAAVNRSKELSALLNN